MTQRPLRPSRDDSPDSVLLLSIGALFVIATAVLWLSACSSTTAPDTEVTEKATSEPAQSQDHEGEQKFASNDASRDKRSETEPSEVAAVEEVAVEEMVVVGSRAQVDLASPSASAVAFDSVTLASPGRAGHSSLGVAHYAPNLEWNTERYDSIGEAGFLSPKDKPLSTFSVDVDTASYSNVRRFLNDGSKPPEGAVRIEEMVNYFRYPTPAEAGDHPFAVETEIFAAPWSKTHRLARIALAGREIPESEVPPRNLVFLLDVSGSMQGPDRLGLVKRGLTGLVERLRPEDRVSIVVYAGASGMALPPTRGDERAKILGALESLSAGGSTHGAAGIRLAYETARKHFDGEGINRVILATDGDFNVGVTSRSELVGLIEKERESGVFLTVLGFGRGNLNDAGMEELADKGNGNYAYIDSPAEARKVLVQEAGSTLVTIAKDVKIQVEFNPARVAGYRLIGYENRRLEDRDFNDDKKDAGEIGAGHHVTALYEIIPVGVPFEAGVDPLKYQKPAQAAGERVEDSTATEWLTVKLRYKAPQGTRSELMTQVLGGEPVELAKASESGRFTAAVALFGMLLRDSDYRGEGDFELAQSLARDALGGDPRGERAEFVRLVALAKALDS
jgi:Ca-activated chloride channel family protein